LGTVRVQVHEHRVIVDSKPENTVADLRLVDCWLDRKHNDAGGGGFTELRELANQTDMEKLDDRDHGHVPFVVILLKALDTWWQQQQQQQSNSSTTTTTDNTTTTQHQKRPPKTFEEKKIFRSLIRSMSRNFDRELNFQEAYNDAYLAYTKLELDYDTLERLRTSTIQSLRDKVNGVGGGSKIQSIDLLLHSLKIFMMQTVNGDGERIEKGSTPVNGSVPDMASSTEGFVRIQTLYKDRAEQDRKKMRDILDQLLTELYPTTTTSEDERKKLVVTDEELSKFTRNVHSLRYLRTRRWTDEYDLTYSSSANDNNDDEDIKEDLLATTYDPYEDKHQTPLLWYIALRACDAFHDQEGIYPGSDGRDLALKSDAVIVQNHIRDIVKRMGLQPDDEDDEGLIRTTLLQIEDDDSNDDATAGSSGKYAKEVVRYYNAELHNVASVVGGVASQEVVKLITGQYVPMDGTYTFNGLASVAGVYKV